MGEELGKRLGRGVGRVGMACEEIGMEVYGILETLSGAVNLLQ